MSPRFSRRGILGAATATAMASPLLASGGAPAESGIVNRYIKAWRRRDLADIVDCMAENVRFVAPNVRLVGREPYRAATARFLSLVREVRVRAVLQEKSRAMLAYDFACVPPIGTSAVAELIEIKKGLITSTEIFFDTAPFAKLTRNVDAAPASK